MDPSLEYQIQQGEGSTNKRTVTKLTEKSYLNYHTTPMIPEIQNSIQNPNNLIESNASNTWIRGGLASRDMTRDVKA